MPDRLIDTNILVYAYDTSEGAKHDFAKNIVKQIWQDPLLASFMTSQK